MQNSSLISALSICRKAGALTLGFDPVKEAVNTGKAVLVLLAKDLSPKTAKKAHAFCQEIVECIPIDITMQELSAITHKPTGVFAVTDCNLAKLCRAKLPETKEEYHGNET